MITQQGRLNRQFLIIDHHALSRRGLSSWLHEGGHANHVHAAGSLSEGLAVLNTSQPDFVIFPSDLPDLKLEALVDSCDGHQSRLLVLLPNTDSDTIRVMLEAGVHGILVRSTDLDLLEEAIETVESGDIFLAPAATRGLAQVFRRQHDKDLRRLTPREYEVATLLAEGKLVRDIADHLGLSPKTIEVHRKKIFDKLGINGIAELTKIALKEGLISLD